MRIRNSFLLLFYSKQSDYLIQGQVWEWIWILEPMTKGVKNDIFWSEIGSGFEEPGLTPPPRIPRGSPGSQSKYMFNVLLLKSKRPTRIVF